MQHPQYSSGLFPVWTTIPVRFRDLDPLNHVNNAIFSTYYEEARVRFINEVPEFYDQLEQKRAARIPEVENKNELLLNPELFK